MKKVILLLAVLSLCLSCVGLLTMGGGDLDGTWDGTYGSLYFNTNTGEGDYTAGANPQIFTFTFDETSLTGTITRNNTTADFEVAPDYETLEYSGYTYTKRD